MVLHLTFGSSLKLWSHLFSVDKLGPFRIAAVGELPDLPALISHAVLWHFCRSLIDLLLLSALLFCGSLGQLLLWKAYGKEGQPTLNGWLQDAAARSKLHGKCHCSKFNPKALHLESGAVSCCRGDNCLWGSKVLLMWQKSSQILHSLQQTVVAASVVGYSAYIH